MANLLDTIRQNQQQMTQPQGVQDDTSRLSGLLRAKSGKAVGGADTAQSSLGEQAAVAGTNQALAGIQGQANVQNQQMAQQQAGMMSTQNAQEQGINQARSFNTIQTKLKTDALLADLERSKGQIDQKQKSAAVEQIAQNLRLDNQQYIDNLQREGDRARLGDSAAFSAEMTRAALGDNQALLEKNLGNQSVLKANDREFQKSLVQMGLDDSYAMFQNSMRAQNQQATIGAVGSAVTTGIGAYNTYQNRQTPQTPQTATPVGGQSVQGDNPMFKNEVGYKGGR